MAKIYTRTKTTGRYNLPVVIYEVLYGDTIPNRKQSKVQIGTLPVPFWPGHISLLTTLENDSGISFYCDIAIQPIQLCRRLSGYEIGQLANGLSIAERMSQVCIVLSQRLRTNEPVTAGGEPF
ncbi:hypothetical protein A8F94_08575 [Bacillus sp. FJAT-27225]|uniref:hypothetical protein n=1 Tax=Bacillus sp. FJAT-27225 TaxID=1743144 RepID=UPI00080C2F7B|nr:hypothetical protein [Bacillus sp. FJAT-27225]OCA87882.1 hypothetical protein A8F94_08575 [Bacillus sp. FJAT-27225]